jgi:predicted O-methyltransferase YrrM
MNDDPTTAIMTPHGSHLCKRSHMDDKVTAVLDTYHELIREQEQNRDATPAADRHTERDHRLLAVGPQIGRLINILAGSLKAPQILELGTSYGYSGIWLADAARATGGRLTTMELQNYKSAYARDMATKAGLADYLDFKVGDAVQMIGELPFRLDFVLVDLWKDLYVPCLEAFYPKLNPGAIIVADNMLHPGGDEVRRYGKAVRAKPGITSVLLPVGSGLEISRLETD